MNLQSKRYNVPGKDKLPPCSTWFREKEERKIMIARKHKETLPEHKHVPIEGIINPPTASE